MSLGGGEEAHNALQQEGYGESHAVGRLGIVCSPARGRYRLRFR